MKKKKTTSNLPENFFEKAKYGLDGLAELLGKRAVEPLRKMGRPPVESPKRNGTLRLDPDVWAGIKAGGRGYNVRVESILREALEQGRL